jgi:hypothetical protein
VVGIKVSKNKWSQAQNIIIIHDRGECCRQKLFAKTGSGEHLAVSEHKEMTPAVQKDKLL